VCRKEGRFINIVSLSDHYDENIMTFERDAALQKKAVSGRLMTTSDVPNVHVTVFVPSQQQTEPQLLLQFPPPSGLQVPSSLLPTKKILTHRYWDPPAAGTQVDPHETLSLEPIGHFFIRSTPDYYFL